MGVSVVSMGEPMATLSPEQDAEQVLQRYWNLGVTSTVPVDPIFIARQMGIQVLETRLDAGVSGMLVKQHGSPPTIYLSETDSRGAAEVHLCARTRSLDEALAYER
jgi:hypothetical protein